MPPTREELEHAAQVLRSAWSLERKKRSNPGGRPRLMCICPTCSREFHYTQLKAHLHHCPKNGRWDADLEAELVIITIDEWRAQLDSKKYVCPVGCGAVLPYREMSRHIDRCPKQNRLEPYPTERWRHELITQDDQPGASLRRGALAKAQKERTKGNASTTAATA